MYLSLLIATAIRGLLLNRFEHGMNSISKCYEFQFRERYGIFWSILSRVL